MRRRIRLKKKYIFKFKNKINTIIILIILIAIAIIIGFNYINKKVSPLLLSYAEVEAKKLASLVVMKAVSEDMEDDLSLENLFVINRSDEGEIRTIDFNPVTVNSLLKKATTAVQVNLKHLENGDVDKLNFSDSLDNYNIEKLKKGIFYEIPSGVVLGNSVLANLGPKIPVRFSLVGNIVTNIATDVKDYGINNALIEVKINVKLNERVILPVSSSSILFEVDIPIALKIVQGAVPGFYYNGLAKSSSLTVPIE